MSRVLGRLRYFLSDAVDEWRFSPGVNLLAIATLAFALFIAGLVLLVLSNVSGVLGSIQDEAPVQAFLRDGVSPEARAEVEARIRAVPGVAAVHFVDKEEALRRFRQSFGDLADLAGEIGSNPLPASLDATLVQGPQGAEAAEAVVRALQGIAAVEEVRYDRAWRDRLEAFLLAARGGGAGLAVLVFAAVAFVMANVLRLAVYARREEIEIMLLVGATPSFVRGPFLVAGLLQGLVASVLALGLVEGVRRAVLAYAGSLPGALLDLAAGRPLALTLALLLAAVGLAVGFAGSYLAVRRFE
jgi:cell division transport system permease protein